MFGLVRFSEVFFAFSLHKAWSRIFTLGKIALNRQSRACGRGLLHQMFGLVRFRVRDSRVSAILPGRTGSRGVLFCWAEMGFGALGALFAFE